MRDKLGDPESRREEQQSLAVLADCEDFLGCICPEPCWCIHDRFLYLGPSQEEADIGEETFDG